MKICRDSWHYQLYAFNGKLWHNFIHGNEHGYEWTHPHMIGICEYIRGIVIWGPLLYLIYLAVFGSALFVAIGFPLWVMQGTGAVVAISLVVFICLFISGLFAVDKAVDYMDSRPKKPKKVKEGDSFGKLFVAFLIGIKEKVCPIAEIE